MPPPIVTLHSDAPAAPLANAAANAATAAEPVAATRPRHALYALVVVILLAWFASLELRGLFIPDEGRYAEIPREMLDTGDWVTPRLNGLKYFEKPPLQYWLTAASYAVLGEDEWTARLPSTLLGFLAVLMTVFTARRLWGPRSVMTTAVILASSWAYYLSGQYLTLDIMLSAFLTFALCGFLLAQDAEASPSQRRRWMLVAWASCAFAVLCKGLIGIALPGLALVVYSVIGLDFRLWRRLEIVRGLTLMLLITVPWFVLVQQRNPEFFEFFFIREHFQRFASNEHSRLGEWWYYAPILLVGLMPWTPLFVQQAWRAGREPQATPTRLFNRPFRPILFCAIWTAAIIVFFSVSQSKLPAYVIPVFPALALMLGRRAALEDAGGLRWSALTLTALGAVLFAASTQLGRWSKFADIGADGAAALPVVYAATASLLVGGLLALFLLRRSQALWSVVVLVTSSFAFWMFSFVFLHAVDTAFSSERLIESLADDTRPFDRDHEFYSVGQFDHSLPFYLGRTVTLVDHTGELKTGLRAEPGKAIDTVAEFMTIWRRSKEQAYAVMRPRQYEDFVRAELPMKVVTRDRRLVVVSRLPG
jgi:4-amino-4-deoxy-L-arabinose transferase-like glycosyltransferase